MTAGKDRSLDELEDKLWKQFDEACKDAPNYVNPNKSSESSSSYASPGNFTIENRKAIAETAQAIAAIRRERRVEKLTEEQQKIEEEMDKGLKAGVTPLNPIKLKQNTP
ncbi:MAG: hypothetical protein ACAH80_18740 [Alphaproteobacteria bacterium]